jgi:folylpolyglutamate synthase/dihydropteroate synthase
MSANRLAGARQMRRASDKICIDAAHNQHPALLRFF